MLREKSKNEKECDEKLEKISKNTRQRLPNIVKYVLLKSCNKK